MSYKVNPDFFIHQLKPNDKGHSMRLISMYNDEEHKLFEFIEVPLVPKLAMMDLRKIVVKNVEKITNYLEGEKNAAN